MLLLILQVVELLLGKGVNKNKSAPRHPTARDCLADVGPVLLQSLYMLHIFKQSAGQLQRIATWPSAGVD